jgi:Regulator of chromosome condensation (RCC1) repeat
MLLLQVSCGAEHALCIVDVRRAVNRRPVACVYGWGCCSDGRIGPGREDSSERPAEIEAVTLMLRQIKRKPISVAAGGAHSMAVLDVTREVCLHALHMLVVHARVLVLCLYYCGFRAG